jgi:hypothetical protein
MDTTSKNNINNEDKIREDAKRQALEKLKQRAVIVNVDEIADAEARKAADAYMTMSAQKLEPAASIKETKIGRGLENIKNKFGTKEGLKNTAIKMWKHTFFDEYYRQKEINKVREEIKNTGNIYTGRIKDGDKTAHESAMKGISERFISEYEGTLSEGEEKKILDEKDPESVKTRTDIKNLITEYAKGTLNEEAFNNEKVRVLNALNGKDKSKGGSTYADNLFELAKNARLAVEHGAKIEELDFDLDVIVGKAKSSLKTEAHFNFVDKGIDKIKKSKVGRFISPAVLNTAIGIAYSISVGAGKKVLSSKAAAWGTFGAAVAVSSTFAGMNESQRITLERKQHGIEMAEGGEFEEGSTRREQLEKYGYQMEDSNALASNLRDLMFSKDENGKDVIKDIKQEDLENILASLANIEARNSLNSKNKIDLISYSSIGNVEKERTDLTILTARAKVELRKKIEGGLKSGIPEGETFDSYLAKQTQIVEDSLLGGEKGITEQDKAFSKFKAKRVAIKVAQTAIAGLIIGGTVQEVTAFFKDDVQGAVEGIFHQDAGATAQTPVGSILSWMSGHHTHMGMGGAIATHLNGHNFNLPEGTSIIQNSDGTYDILNGNRVISDNVSLNFDANGNLDGQSLSRLGADGIVANTTHTIINGTQEVHSGASDYINNHHGSTTHVARDGWYDNDTPKPIFDQNELKLQWGQGGTGIDTNGNYVFNASQMTSDGSFHEQFSVDAQQQIKAGGVLKMIFSLTQGTQHQVFEVPIDTNGNAVIDPNSEIGKLFFGTENGHAVFKGRFAEVVQSFGSKGGVEHVKSLATLVGNGNDSIVDTIPTDIDTPVINLDPSMDIEPPYFIPIMVRSPLEALKEKQKSDNNIVKPEDIKNIVKPEVVPIVGPEVTPDVVIPVVEIKKEESDGMKEDLKMLNKKIQSSEGIITLSESDFKSAYGKKRYNELKSIPDGKPVTFNKYELQTIGDEMERALVGPRKIAKVENNVTPVSADSVLEQVPVKKVEDKAGIEKTPEVIKSVTENIEVKKVFNVKDLSKVGTELKSKDGSFKVTKIYGGGFFNLLSSKKVEGIYKDKNGVETLVSYKVKDLENEFKKKNIEITKVEEGK